MWIGHRQIRGGGFSLDFSFGQILGSASLWASELQGEHRAFVKVLAARQLNFRKSQ